ncbi:unnamed protein product, partial [Darwinula stevensoni]
MFACSPRSDPPQKSAEQASTSSTAPTNGVTLEKPNLKIGFIKLTDMAPLAIALEKGFFKEEGLNVQLEAQANWKAILDRVVTGEFISIIGHSGCGKSTILNIVAGLYQATTGGVILDGQEVNQPGPDRAVVFQNHALMPWLTVYDNVALA